MFDDAGACAQFGREFLRIGYGSERAIVNDVALVRDEGAAVRLGAQDGMAAELFEEKALRFGAERNDLDRQGMQCAETRRHLGIVDHDDLSLGRLGDDLFVEERASAALDEVKFRIDFVGAVDRDVNGLRSGIVNQRNPGLAGDAGDVGRGGEGFDAGQLAGGVATGDFADGMDGGRPRAEAHGHARLDEADGTDGGFFFQGITVNGGSGHGGTMPERRGRREDFSARIERALTSRRAARNIGGRRAGAPSPMEEVVRNQIREFLAGKGLRKTTQRDAIIEAAFSTDRHYTADELLEMARGIDRTVSRATVYRTLPILVESGLLRELDLGQGRKVYDPNFVDHPHHNHLICLDCQTILEFEDLNMELLENCMAKRMGFTPANKQVRIEARCDELKLKGVCRKSGREVLAAV